jgi:hypothetical protein
MQMGKMQMRKNAIYCRKVEWHFQPAKGSTLASATSTTTGHKVRENVSSTNPRTVIVAANRTQI